MRNFCKPLGIITVGVLSLIVFFAVPGRVSAVDIFTETFETYSTGSLSGQGPWLSTGGTWQSVVSSPTDTGSRALQTFDQNAGDFNLKARYASSTSGTFSFRARLSTGSLDVTSSRPGFQIISTQGVSLDKLQLFYGGSGMTVNTAVDVAVSVGKFFVSYFDPLSEGLSTDFDLSALTG